TGAFRRGTWYSSRPGGVETRPSLRNQVAVSLPPDTNPPDAAPRAPAFVAFFVMYLTDLMTIPANLAGLPGMSVPCGFDSQGMPIGLQILGNVLREDQIFQVAYAYEQSTDWHGRSPILKA
ncbi:MAG: hypothetical protein HC936_09415, partial [Leptolyngbyaceae cyanobacterium SU_3_3]|nr:hypothetical protein [Leptolyngbyaceae cyanobacterium SU_3_3]